MNTKHLYTAALAVGIINITACKKLLEVPTESQITEQKYFKSQEDFEPYVNGIYALVRGSYNIDPQSQTNRFGVNNPIFGIERSEELVVATTPRFSQAWSQNLGPNSQALDYNEWYQVIGHCNLVLDRIDAFSFSNPDSKKQLQAEAYSLRAFTFFHLTRIIGDAPLMLQAVTDANVPLLPRSPAADVMKQIFADLDKAIGLFPTKTFSKTKYRFSYASAQALKAEAKLWSAKVTGGGTTDFNDALAAIQEVEKTSGLTLVSNFKDVTTVRSNSEIILAAFFSRDEQGGNINYARLAFPLAPNVSAALNKEELPITNNPNYGQTAYLISPKSRALFAGFSNDKRIAFTWVWEKQRGASAADTILKNPWINKYPGNYYVGDDRVPDNDLIIFRLADVYLMAAEAYAGIGNLPKSLEYLNKVRKRAGIPDFASMDKAAIEKEILDERGRGLFFENKRWYDLVRFHKGGTINVYTYIPNLAGKNTPLFWPLSASVLSRNPNLKQTDGY